MALGKVSHIPHNRPHNLIRPLLSSLPPLFFCRRGVGRIKNFVSHCLYVRAVMKKYFPKHAMISLPVPAHGSVTVQKKPTRYALMSIYRGLTPRKSCTYDGRTRTKKILPPNAHCGYPRGSNSLANSSTREEGSIFITSSVSSSPFPIWILCLDLPPPRPCLSLSLSAQVRSSH